MNIFVPKYCLLFSLTVLKLNVVSNAAAYCNFRVWKNVIRSQLELS